MNEKKWYTIYWLIVGFLGLCMLGLYLFSTYYK